MIYYATVHWGVDDWIPIQNKFFHTYSGGTFRIFAFLNGIDPALYADYFYYYSTETITDHATKLNLLADMICLDSTNDADILVFIDGDAIPIADVNTFTRSTLSPQMPLAAVQRLENNGDLQPHPCFCVTTVGFWRSIRGDWKSGPTWPNSKGELVTDVGGTLMKQLQDRSEAWQPLLRSNTCDIHPLWYGFYSDVVYHHGAGFRSKISRLDYPVLRKLSSFLPSVALPVIKRLFFKYLKFIDKRTNNAESITLEEILSDTRFFERHIGKKVT